MRRLAVVWILGLTACATVPPAPPPAELFFDGAFQPVVLDEDARTLFALTPAMEAFLAGQRPLRPSANPGPQALAAALYSKDALQLRYDSSLTRTAAQAFAARAGNCLSLVIMTSAFAKALHIPVEYRSARTETVWSRSGDLQVGSGHVNITLSQPDGDSARRSFGGGLTIDFLPSREAEGLRTVAIPETRVVAMFMNNRAAEALVGGRIDEAYAWLRAALAEDPGFAAAWNTLGVVYARRGLAAAAERVLNRALDLQPDDTRTLGNLVRLLAQRGALAEAQALQQRLARLDPEPPFLYFDQGMVALDHGELESARRLFAREVRRADYYAPFHFWLAVVDYRLGNWQEASRELALAEQHSTTLGDRALYAAKRARLAADRAVSD